MDLSLRTEAWTQDDQSWLGSQHGTDTARSITLDVSTFTPATHYPEGYFPSGLALGRITDTGKYGPFDGDATDGREDAAGFLFTAVKAPATN
ncbi:MAG: head decoration protein, partial [Stackebrandtia sp.]